MKKKENIITAIVIIVALIVIAISAFIWSQSKQQQEPKEKVEDEVKEISAEGTPDGEGDYIDEVRYVGGIGYPKVYDIPFQKNDFYVTNKELWEIDSTIPDKCVARARSFANRIFNTSARNIKNDETTRIQSLAVHMDDEWVYWTGDDGTEHLLNEQIEKWNDYIVNNNISIESIFVTDSSLVCENGLIYVRGVLEYEVFSSKDDRLKVKDGVQTAIMEITMHRKLDDWNAYEVVGFQLVDENQKGIAKESVLSSISAGIAKEIKQ